MPTREPDPFECILSGLIDAGLSDAQIAREAGLSRAHVHRLDHRLVANPSFDTYLKLASAYARIVGPPPPIDYSRR